MSSQDNKLKIVAHLEAKTENCLANYIEPSDSENLGT